MIFTTKILRHTSMLTFGISLFVLNACGDSDVANKTQEYEDAADEVKAGNGSISVAELVAEHNIHWSQPALFPADQVDGKTGYAAMYLAITKLDKLAANDDVARQIVLKGFVYV